MPILVLLICSSNVCNLNSYKREQEAREYAMGYGDELIAASRKRNRNDKSLVDSNGNVNGENDEKVEFIIDRLLYHEENFTEIEIRDHVMTLLATVNPYQF